MDNNTPAPEPTEAELRLVDRIMELYASLDSDFNEDRRDAALAVREYVAGATSALTAQVALLREALDTLYDAYTQLGEETEDGPIRECHCDKARAALAASPFSASKEMAELRAISEHYLAACKAAELGDFESCGLSWKISELRKDKARLDWLTATSVILARDFEGASTWSLGSSQNFHNYATRVSSPRAAIDAAMHQEAKS